MKSRKQSRSLSQTLPAPLALAAILILQGTIHAGSMAENPSAAVRSAGIEAVGGVFRSVPPQWQTAIGNFLNSPSYSAADLRQAILSLHEPTAQDIERTHLGYEAQQQGSANMQKLVETKAAGFAMILNNPTPEDTAALVEKVAELNAVVAPYISKRQRKRQAELRKKMERMAEALSRGLSVSEIAQADGVDASRPPASIWQRILPQSWRLRRSSPRDKERVVRMEDAASLKELKKYPIGETGRTLIEAMEADRFIVLNPDDRKVGDNPFSQLRTMEPIARILRRGITQITRTTYKSTEHARTWNVSYDMVRYEIAHPDGTKSFIDAYRQSDVYFQLMMGGLDFRPTYHSILTSDGNDRMTGYLYKNGDLEQNGPISSQDGLAIAENFIRQSISKGALARFGSPQELVTPRSDKE